MRHHPTLITLMMLLDIPSNDEALRLECAEYMQWNDRNGVWSDEACAAERMDPVTLQHCLLTMLAHHMVDLHDEGSIACQHARLCALHILDNMGVHHNGDDASDWELADLLAYS